MDAGLSLCWDLAQKPVNRNLRIASAITLCPAKLLPAHHLPEPSKQLMPIAQPRDPSMHPSIHPSVRSDHNLQLKTGYNARTLELTCRACQVDVLAHLAAAGVTGTGGAGLRSLTSKLPVTLTPRPCTLEPDSLTVSICTYTCSNENLLKPDMQAPCSKKRCKITSSRSRSHDPRTHHPSLLADFVCLSLYRSTTRLTIVRKICFA